MSASPLIRVSGLRTCFGARVVHKNVDLEIYPEEILAIVGGSGSGKSLLLRYLVGLEKPQKGNIIYCAETEDRAAGVLFQNGALISSLTVLENVALPLKEIAKVPEALAEEIALLRLAMVGLDAAVVASQYPASLSGGMVKRVGLARALALDPRILFLDEPTAGLDPIAASNFDALVHDLQKQLKITIIIVTHDLDTLKVCDRIALLVGGEMMVGSLHELRNVQHPWVQEYFNGVRAERLFS